MIVSLRDPEHDDALAEVVVGERIGLERGTVQNLIAALVDSLREDHERSYNKDDKDDDIKGRLERESFLLAVLIEQLTSSGEGWSALVEETGKRVYGPYPERRAAEDAARERNTAYTGLRATLRAAQDAFYEASLKERQDARARASGTTCANTTTAKE